MKSGLDELTLTKLTADDFARVVVVGTSCAGKTTLARTLARMLGARHIELDTHFWRPQWEKTPDEEFQPCVERIVADASWIIDGNYTRFQPTIIERATMLVWLDYSFARILGRALRRTVKRALSGEELFGGNRESFRRSFLTSDSILLWVLKSYPMNKMRYTRIFAEEGHLACIRLRHPRATNRFLQMAVEIS